MLAHSVVMELSTFTLFPALPKELRLQIWKYSLPEPRLLEFGFGYHMNLDMPIESDFYWEKLGPRMWATRSASTRPSLLQVNTEARGVALGSYEAISVCDQSSPDFTKTYVDFSRDTILMSLFAWECLHESIPKPPPSPWTEKIQHFALMPYRQIVTRHGGPTSIFAGLSDKDQNEISPQDRKSDLEFCSRVLKDFPHLESFELVIDGRHPDADRKVDLVEPTDAYEDYHQPNRRVRTLEWAAGLQSCLDEEFNASRSCPVNIKLLINQDEEAKIERFWCYFHFLCHFTRPETQTSRFFWGDSNTSENENQEVHQNNDEDFNDDDSDEDSETGDGAVQPRNFTCIYYDPDDFSSEDEA